MIKDQLEKQQRGRSASSSNERPVKLRRKPRISNVGDSVDITQSQTQTYMGNYSRRSRVEAGLESTAQKILAGDSNGAGVVSVFGRRQSRNAEGSYVARDRSNEVYESKFGNQLESKYQDPSQSSPPTKLTASQLI